MDNKLVLEALSRYMDSIQNSEMAESLARKAEVESVVKMTMSVFATVMMASLIYMEFFPAHRPSLEIYEQVPRAQGAELNESEEPKKDQTREDWKGSVLADL